jgi:MFS family permease
VERNKALGIWSGIGGVGATSALLIGGPLTDGLGWEWIFFINIPVALALLALSPKLLRESFNPECVRCFDVAGAATITAALVALVYAIVEAPDVGWADPQTIGLLIAFAALLAVFAAVEGRSVYPLVPLRIFRARTLVGGNLVLAALGIAAFGLSLIVSLYAQQVLGYSALEFGLGTAMMTVGAVVGSTVGQAIVTRVGSLAVAGVGFVLTGAGCVLLTRVSAEGSYVGDIFFGLLIFGPGLGATYVAASVATLAGVAERESGLASALNNAAFQIGGALGTAIVTTVAVSEAAGPNALVALTEGFQAAFAAAIAFSGLGLLFVILLLGRPREPRAPVREPSAARVPEVAALGATGDEVKRDDLRRGLSDLGRKRRRRLRSSG